MENEQPTIELEEPIIISQQSRERGDIVRPLRLQGFSDAVFATAATLLVIPIRKFEYEGETLKEALLKKWPQLFVFVVGFLLICAIWESHIIRFKVVSKVDDVVVFLTLLSLMVTTFLPFTVALEGHFAKYEISVILNCFLLLGIELIEVIIFIYAFNNPKLLSDRFKRLDAEEMKFKKRQIMFKVLLNSSLFILAAVFSFASFIVSWILIGSVIIMPLLRRMIIKLSNRWTCCYGNGINQSTYEVLTGRISKERIEVFSDAATAIVATLLILDLTTEEFPKQKEVDDIGLGKVLSNMWQMFVAYMGTYATVGFLWFVHHSLLQHVKLFTPLMVLFNDVFLAFLAGSPFISTLVNKFTGQSSHNEKIAVRVSSFILFMASFMQVAILICALWQKNHTLHSWAIPHDNIQHTSRTHRYLLLKTLIIPSITMITFLSSFGSEKGTYYVYHVALFLVPVLFIALKIAFACHCSQHNEGGSPNTSRHSSMSETSISVVTTADVQPHTTEENVNLLNPRL